jgi:mannose-6-phosphate isomerase-like protein (cupin superfamily)
MILPILLLMMFQPPILENEYVTVHMATDQPHSKGSIHRHTTDRVMIYLDEGPMRIENVNGPVENQIWKAGQVAWSPASGEHTSENVGNKVLRIIEVELKPVVPSGKPFSVSPLDPVTVDPKHYWLEFENSRVRVIHGKYNLHETGVMHEHLSRRLVVYLTDKEMVVTTQDGKGHLLKSPADYVWWPGYAKHVDRAVDDPIEMVVVELK